MSHILWGPDEWEMVNEYKSYGSVHGVPMGFLTHNQRRRSPEEIAVIKARRQREHELAVLQEAAAIIARHSAT